MVHQGARLDPDSYPRDQQPHPHAGRQRRTQTCVQWQKDLLLQDPLSSPQAAHIPHWTSSNCFSVQTLCNNTSKKAVKNIAKGKKYTWTDINHQEFWKFLGLTFFFALVKLKIIRDYWGKKDTNVNVPFPANVMLLVRCRVIPCNTHMSDPDKDVENDRKKGASDYHCLFRLKPLLESIRHACIASDHPRQNLSTDERMVATKASTGMTRCMKARPTKWGFKLFWQEHFWRHILQLPVNASSPPACN